MKRVNQVTKLGGKSEMISQIKQQGFTIVELLIVIVVIAILAALSYVGYTSITARANNSTAAATAKAVKDAAQVYQGANGSFPTTQAQFRNGGTDPVAKLPSDIVFGTSAYGADGATASTTAQGFNDDNKAKTVLVYACGTTGFKIVTKNFTGANARVDTVGTCDSGVPAAAATVVPAT